LPAVTALSKADVQKYHNSCAVWFDTVLKKSGFNGGIIVAKNGNIVYENYMGAAHLGQTDTINANTAFHIASVSKTFTAMAVLKLAQEGKLNIDDELVKYFSTFNYPGITIRSLLSHRSGLPKYEYFFEKLKWNKKSYVNNQDVYDYLVKRKGELENIGAANRGYAYSNTNYALLALLIEKISGSKYPQFMKQTFFDPLKMKNTFVFDTSMLQKVIPSYDWKGELVPFNFLDAVYGDKNIYSTAHDLLTWDKALTSGKIFSDSTLAEAYAPYSNEKPGLKNYGLGWHMYIFPNGKKIIYHNGWWHGNNAAFVRLLEDSATIILTGNKFNRNIYHAKEMAPLFGNYGGAIEEEEEASPAKKETTVDFKPLVKQKAKRRK
jgi:CubicO group peptidase (beta-lactamase class C family)